MRVLVTGASGTIGRPLTAALADAGYRVHAAVRDGRAQQFPPAAEVVRLPDLSSPIDWTPLLAGVEAVVHLAGIAHTGSGPSEDQYDRINHRATAELAHAAAAAKVRRLVFASSIRAQSGTHSDRTLAETDPPHPTEPYGRSKLAAEQAVRAAGVPYTILRPVLVYAPGAKGNLASLLRLAHSPLPLPFGRIDNRRSLLAVENLVSAIRFALDDDRAKDETFIVSDPRAVSVPDIVTICRGALGRGAGLLSAPPGLLAALFGIVGQSEKWNRIAGSLEAPPTKLLAAGWRPVTDTRAGLAALVTPPRR
jgi:nucleoside-diphosphate-sugar epimerase